MIKMLIAHSSELDNPEKTVRDIVGQIDLQNGLLKNTIALLFCHAKFIEMGVTEVVCKNLPFDVVGCTSQFFALPDQAGEILLTVAVLTSDDTEFAAGVSDPLDELNTADCVHSLYANTKASLGADPDLVFAFEPTMINVTPDIVTMALDSACAGIPVFGSCATWIHWCGGLGPFSTARHTATGWYCYCSEGRSSPAFFHCFFRINGFLTRMRLLPGPWKTVSSV